MKIASVLVACNDNPTFLEYWPIVKEAWLSIANLPCTLVFVGDSLPEALQNDSSVKFFKAIPGWSTATQAKCIRLLYPALFNNDSSGAILISDMDVIPLQRDFYSREFVKFNVNNFVMFRGTDKRERTVPTCYYAAVPSIWGDIFNIKKEEDLLTRLTEWSQKSKNGCNWLEQEQLELYTIISLFDNVIPERVELIRWSRNFSRLDRVNHDMWYLWNNELEQNLRNKSYIDFRMPSFKEFGKHISIIVDYSKNLH